MFIAKKYIGVFLSGLAILVSVVLHGQEKLKFYVPLIESKLDQVPPKIDQSGAGLIVGETGGTLYVVTAAHVIRGAVEVELTLYKDSIRKYPARVIKEDHILDLAVVTIENSNPIRMLPLNLKMEQGIIRLQTIPRSINGANNDVLSIGHPTGERWATIPNKMLGSRRDHTIGITGTGITTGCSGGPVFGLTGWELIGMVKEDTEAGAVCIKASKIKQKLEEWGVPNNLLFRTEDWWLALDNSWKNHFAKKYPLTFRAYVGDQRKVPQEAFFEELFTQNEFDCNDCGINDLNPMARFGELEELTLRDNQIVDLSPLANLKKLRKLDLRFNHISSIQSIENLIDLEEINMTGNELLMDLSPVKNLHKLKRVNFSLTGVRSIRALELLQGLKKIQIFLTNVPREEIRRFKKKKGVKIAFRHRWEGLPHLLAILENRQHWAKESPFSIESEEITHTPQKDNQLSSSYDNFDHRQTGSSLKPEKDSEIEVDENKESLEHVSDPQPQREIDNSELRKSSVIGIPQKESGLDEVQEKLSVDHNKKPEKRIDTRPEPERDSSSKSVEEQLKSLLQDRRFRETERFAATELGKDPGNHLYRVYVVLGLAYQGQFEKARQLWFLFKRRTLRDGQNFTDKILDEIRMLDNRGVSNPTVKKFRDLIAR